MADRGAAPADAGTIPYTRAAARNRADIYEIICSAAAYHCNCGVERGGLRFMAWLFIFLDRAGGGMCDDLPDDPQNRFPPLSAKVGPAAESSQKHDLGPAERIQLCFSA
ncbi:hypothetical protein D3C79_839810 [compost metagenome]